MVYLVTTVAPREVSDWFYQLLWTPAAMLSAVSLVVTAAIGLLALVTSRSSVMQQGKVAAAKIVQTFLTEYASKEMQQALEWLRQQLANETEMIERLRPLAVGNEPANPSKLSLPGNKDERELRRRVHYYFKRAWWLYENKYLPAGGLKLVVDNNGLSLLFSVVDAYTRAGDYVLVCNRDIERYRQRMSRFDWYSRLKKFADDNGIRYDI